MPMREGVLGIRHATAVPICASLRGDHMTAPKSERAATTDDTLCGENRQKDCHMEHTAHRYRDRAESLRTYLRKG